MYFAAIASAYWCDCECILSPPDGAEAAQNCFYLPNSCSENPPFQEMFEKRMIDILSTTVLNLIKEVMGMKKLRENWCKMFLWNSMKFILYLCLTDYIIRKIIQVINSILNGVHLWVLLLNWCFFWELCHFLTKHYNMWCWTYPMKPIYCHTEISNVLSSQWTGLTPHNSREQFAGSLLQKLGQKCTNGWKWNLLKNHEC